MKNNRSIRQVLIVLLSSLRLAYSASNVAAHLEQTIELPGVHGRIDHMSFDVASGRLFVSALGNNTVEVIDTKQAKRIHSIAGLHEPQGVLYLADVNRIYVANGGDGTVNILDGSSYQLLKSVPLGSDADNLRFDPGAKEIYVGYGSGALAVLREDGSKVKEIKLDAHPESFQLERKGTRIFVNLPDSRKVAVVDRDTGAVTMSWSTGSAFANFPMALDESQRLLFIVCRLPARLLVFDIETGKVVAKLAAVGDCDDLFFDPGSNRIFASGGEGGITIIDQQTKGQYREAAKVITRKGARTSFLASESRRLYVAARQQGSEAAAIYVYNIE